MKYSHTQLYGLFSEVVRGYSVSQHKDFGRFYIKHFCSVDFADIEAEREIHLQKAKSKGLHTREEAEQAAIKSGALSPSLSSDIAQQQIFIENLKLTKKKLLLKAEIEAMAKEIVTAEAKLTKLETEKAEILGFCAEHFAEKKLTEFYIISSFFRDAQATTPIFSKETFEEVVDTELLKLIALYNDSCMRFDSSSLKQVALTPAFLNGFYLCKDNPYTYFGKPVMALSAYQVELFGYGRYFKGILTETQDSIPDDIRDDPEKLIEWYDSHKNAEKLLEKTKTREGGAVSIVGATAEDRKRLGLDGHTIDFAAEAKKKGGSMNFQDILKLHNEL